MAKTAAKKPAAKTTSKAAPKAASKAAPKAAPKAPAKAAAAPASAPMAAPAAATLGFFDVPTVERAPWGLLGLILNIIPGGVGTIIAGAKINNMGQIVKGILQFLLTWTVIAWVWSIIDGVRIFQRSTQPAA